MKPAPFLCPHCGALKDNLVFAAAVDFEHTGDDLGVLLCSACDQPIIFLPSDPARTARAPTSDETDEVVTALRLANG